MDDIGTFASLQLQNQETASLTNTPTEMSKPDKEALQNKMINEEYKIWKKNAVFLYDVMYR